MKPKKNALFLAGSLTALLASHSAHALGQTWDNGATNSTWDDTSLNWAAAAWTDGNDAVFGAAGAGVLTVSGTRSVVNLTLSSAGYSFSGGTLSVANLTAANTWTIGNDTAISSGVTTDFSAGAVTGTLNKLGAAKLTLSGVVNSTGVSTGAGNWGITVSAGSLELSGTSTFSNAGLIVGGTGTATISGGTHNFTGAVQRIGLAITAGRSVTVSGGTVNTVKILAGNGSSGIYTQSGGTVILPTTGVVELGTAGNTTDTSVFNLDGGTLTALQLAPTATWKGTTTINLNGGTLKAVGIANTNLFSASGALSLPGSVFVKAGGAVIDPNGRSVTISSTLLTHPTSTGGGLTKQGGPTTTLTLSGANTYTGTTTINAGGLIIGSASTSTGSTILSGATGVGDVELGNNVTLGQTDKDWYANKVTLKGNITLEGNLRQQVGFKTLDLDGNTRTVFVNPTGGNVKQTITGDIALEGTGRSRWEMLDISDTHPFVPNVGTLTVQNGTLALASNLTGTNYAGFMFQFPSIFAANAGLIVGPNVLLQTAVQGALGTTTDSTKTAKLTVNGIWTLGSSTGTGHTVHSLAGSGKIYTSMVAGNATARTITLNGTTGSTDFSGVLADGPGTGKLSVVKTGASTQILSGANIYTGTTSVNGGTLALVGGSHKSPITVVSAASLGFTLSSPTTSTSTLTLNAGHSIKITGTVDNASDYLLMTASTITGTPTLDSPIANYQLQKATGDTQLKLVYTGGGGNTAPTISDIANLSVPSGGSTGALAFTVTDETPASVVPSGGSDNLALVPVENIVFGGSGANRTATVTPVSGLTGTATITVTVTDAGSLTATDTFVLTVTANYLSWSAANAGNQASNLDFDNDGVSNGVEYFMGQSGSTFTANPSIVTVGSVRTVTWPRDPAAVATFKVQTSDTLAAGGWTDVVPPDASIDESSPNQVTFTLPSIAPKKFCRLSVTP